MAKRAAAKSTTRGTGVRAKSTRSPEPGTRNPLRTDLPAIEAALGGEIPPEYFGRFRQAMDRRLGKGGVMQSFDAAGHGRRHKDYRRSVGSLDLVLERQRLDLVALHRALYDNCLPFQGFIENFVTTVVGRGLRPRGRTDAAKESVRVWERWSRKPDHRGFMTGGELQRMALRETILAGDVAAMKVEISGDLAVATGRLQLVEAERIGNHRRQTEEGNPIIDGVEFARPPGDVGSESRSTQPWGEPVAYHIADYQRSGGGLGMTPRRVEAGHVLFMRRAYRPSQTRGVPALHAGLERAAMLEDYLDAHGVAANIEAMMAFLWTRKNPAAAKSVLKSGETDTRRLDTGGTAVDDLIRFVPGTVLIGEHNDELKAAQGNRPSAQFGPYVQSILALLALGLGMPVQILLRDFSKVNFSSGRAAWYLADLVGDLWREMLIARLLAPSFEWVAARAVAAGELGPGVPPSAYADVDWIAPARPVIDPQQEAAADRAEVEANFATWESVVIARGGDPDAVHEQRRREIERDRRDGTTPPGIPGSKPAGAGGGGGGGGDPAEPEPEGGDGDGGDAAQAP